MEKMGYVSEIPYVMDLGDGVTAISRAKSPILFSASLLNGLPSLSRGRGLPISCKDR